MRVIAGKHRGIVLNEFKGKDIRPTADRTKEAIFNILQGDIDGSVCLDLFCGTGNLGIEAISRGAKKVLFVDISKDSVELAKSNLKKVKENAEVYCIDAISFLKRTKEIFDIVFIDPPYADDVSEKAVDFLINNNLLAEDGKIVFERDKPFGYVQGASVYKSRKYGKANVCFIRKERACLFAGTFDPFTLGHEKVVEEALKKYDKIYVTLMSNPDKTPMFSIEERKRMIELLYHGDNRVVVDCWDGMLVDYMKQKNIRYNVRGIRSDNDLTYEKEMEEYNLKIYPELVYDYIYTGSYESSTEARNRIINGEELNDIVNKKISEYVYKIKTK